MLSRRWARAARPSTYIPASSGPRCVITARMRVARWRASGPSCTQETSPAMPHMSGRHRVRHVLERDAAPVKFRQIDVFERGGHALEREPALHLLAGGFAEARAERAVRHQTA